MVVGDGVIAPILDQWGWYYNLKGERFTSANVAIECVGDYSCVKGRLSEVCWTSHIVTVTSWCSGVGPVSTTVEDYVDLANLKFLSHLSVKN